MIAVVVLVMIAGAVLRLLFARRARRSELAGLDSGRPQFTVEPPARRLGSRNTERL